MNNISIIKIKIRFDQIYHEQIKEPISDMLTGKNSCVLLFGPSEGGKSYLLRGGENQKGLLDRAVDDLFNFVEINKQVNQGKANRSISSYRLKTVIYYVYNDNIYDLLSGNSQQKQSKVK